MRKRIVVDPSGYEKLIKKFNISRQSVWKALTFKTQSDLSEQIRYMATTMLGGVIISDTNDNMDGNSKAIVHQGSFVDTGDKLIQAYDNGFFLIIDKVSGTIKINGRNGLPHTVFDNAAVKQIAVLQELAKTLK